MVSSVGRRIPYYLHESALGEVLKLDVQIKDQAGTVLPLDGYTARYSILDHRSVELAYFTPMVILDKIVIRALIEGLSPGKYKHALRIKAGDTGDELVLFKGELMVEHGLADM